MADKSIQKLKPGTTPPAVPFVLVFGAASLGFGFAFDYLNVETLLRNVRCNQACNKGTSFS